MIFEGLNEKFQNVFSNLKKKGKLTEADIKKANREIKLALLEADVNFKVVKEFIKSVGERANGEEVLKSLTPAQQYVKVVNDELTRLLGGKAHPLEIKKDAPNILMMVGLQGAGKTTTAAKLANLLRKEKKLNPLLVACDVQRPAAVKQLQVLGNELNIPVYAVDGHTNPRIVARQAIALAEKNGHDLVIIDTAGRLHVDEVLMQELEDISKLVSPTEILLTVDGMTGQESVTVAKEFNDRLGITGVILTKLDGDTRGGAALSITYTTGQDIVYIGTGEKLADLEPFYPDRMANRILGMGDVLSFIDKAQHLLDEEKAQKMEERLRAQKFDLNDFWDSISQVNKMGDINSLLEMFGGQIRTNTSAEAIEDHAKQTEAILSSMTEEERKKPAILNASRKKRIAMGSGTTVNDVNKLLKSYEQSRKMIKQLTGTKKKRKKRFSFPFM